MTSRPAPLSDTLPPTDTAAAWAEIVPIGNPTLELMVRHLLSGPLEGEHAYGRLEALAVQLASIQHRGFDIPELKFEAPQLLVFAADHGIAVESISSSPQEATVQRTQSLLAGTTPVNALARSQGFDITLVDAGIASPIEVPKDPAPQVNMLHRKIGHGTRNMVLAPAMSLAQTQAAIEAGMDVVRHLPGNVVAMSNVGVAGNASAAQLLSRLCNVPLADACGKEQASDAERALRKLNVLFAAASRHRKATAALDALAAMGGFEIAMLCGAMLQAASERRVILIDGFVASAAALVARGLNPAVIDYCVFAHRASEPGHRLLLIHLQANPLLDLNMRAGQGMGALLAWPMLPAAQKLLRP